jgi:hypothetical protein
MGCLAALPLVESPHSAFALRLVSYRYGRGSLLTTTNRGIRD